MFVQLTIISVLVSFLFGLPHIVGLLQNSPYISTIVIGGNSYTFDENHYAARIQKSFVNLAPVSDAYTYEYRTGPYIFPSVSTYLLGLLARFTGSVQTLFIISDFLFPPLIFLVIYSLAKQFISKKQISIIASLLVLLEDRIYGYFPTILESIKTMSLAPFAEFFSSIYMPPFYSRLENPEFSGIFFFLGLFFIAGHRMFSFSVCQLVLLYSYPFYAVYLFLIFTGLFLANLISKTGRKIFLKNALLIFIFSLPFIFQFLTFIEHPGRSDLIIRNGKEVFTLFKIPVSALMTVFVLLSIYLKNNKDKPLILSFFIFTSIVAMYIFPVQTDHYITRVLVPVLRISQIYIFYSIFKTFFINKFTNSLLYCALIGIFLLSFTHQLVYTKNKSSTFTISPTRLEAYKWLSENTPPDSVILSYSVLSNVQIPAFAAVYMFLPYSVMSFVPTEEVKDRLLLSYKSIGATEIDLQKSLGFFDSPSWDFSEGGIETKGYYVYFGLQWQRQFIDTEIKAFLLEFKNFKKESNVALLKKKYKLDYLFWGPFEKKYFSVPKDSLKKVFSNGEFDIYKVI